MKRIITKITHRSTDWGWRVIVDGEEIANGSADTYPSAVEGVWGVLQSLPLAA